MGLTACWRAVETCHQRITLALTVATHYDKMYDTATGDRVSLSLRSVNQPEEAYNLLRIRWSLMQCL